LLAKESVKEVAPDKGSVAAAPPPSAKTNSASSGTVINKISDKDDIFEIYRKIKN
jgi:hypothetical protein